MLYFSLNLNSSQMLLPSAFPFSISYLLSFFSFTYTFFLLLSIPLSFSLPHILHLLSLTHIHLWLSLFLLHFLTSSLFFFIFFSPFLFLSSPHSAFLLFFPPFPSSSRGDVSLYLPYSQDILRRVSATSPRALSTRVTCLDALTLSLSLSHSLSLFLLVFLSLSLSLSSCFPVCVFLPPPPSNSLLVFLCVLTFVCVSLFLAPFPFLPAHDPLLASPSRASSRNQATTLVYIYSTLSPSVPPPPPTFFLTAPFSLTVCLKFLQRNNYTDVERGGREGEG